MAAPIFIERDKFIHWLNENPHEIDNATKYEHEIPLKEIPSVINGLIETYCDREKS